MSTVTKKPGLHPGPARDKLPLRPCVGRPALLTEQPLTCGRAFHRNHLYPNSWCCDPGHLYEISQEQRQRRFGLGPATKGSRAGRGGTDVGFQRRLSWER